jgi:hypothetical protein
MNSPEPTNSELEAIDAKAYDNALQNLHEIWIFEKNQSDRGDYLDELANEAWFYFVTVYSKNPKNKTLFIESVLNVIPHISDFHRDKGEILREIIHEVASRLSKMIWKNRQRKKARGIVKAKNRPLHSVIIERRKTAIAKATDVMIHGTSHGELILPGVLVKNPPKIWRPRISTKIWKKREPIKPEECLGNILSEADGEVAKLNFKNAFGYHPP